VFALPSDEDRQRLSRLGVGNVKVLGELARRLRAGWLTLVKTHAIAAARLKNIPGWMDRYDEAFSARLTSPLCGDRKGSGEI